MICGRFSLAGVDDDPVDSYGGPADDGRGEDDGHHHGHAVQATMVCLMCTRKSVWEVELDIDVITKLNFVEVVKCNAIPGQPAR